MTAAAIVPRLHCIAESRERSEAIEALVRVVAPDAVVSHAAQPLAPANAPAADAVIVDLRCAPASDAGAPEEARASPGVEAVRRLRAGGFAGQVIVISEEMATPDDAAGDELTRLGATAASPARLAAVLTAALTQALEPRAAEAGASALLAQVARTRQLLAAGEIAIGLQHSMNNPLAAILAESQLLEMDTLSPEQREAVSRIVALCRRMTAVVRRLDGVGGRAGGGGSTTGDR